MENKSGYPAELSLSDLSPEKLYGHDEIAQLQPLEKTSTNATSKGMSKTAKILIGIAILAAILALTLALVTLFVTTLETNKLLQNQQNKEGSGGVTCKELPELNNGKVTTNKGFDSTSRKLPLGTIANYSCNSGYVLIGQAATVCEDTNGRTGAWSGSRPTCEPILCSELTSLDDGTITIIPGSSSIHLGIGSISIYSCNEGYVRVGPIARVCENTVGTGVMKGKWSGNASTCAEFMDEEIKLLTDRINALEEGQRSINTSVQEIAQQTIATVTTTPLPSGCGDATVGWKQVAYLDMTDPNQQCPDGLRPINSTSPPLRLCGRMGPTTGCISTIIPVNGTEYTHVYGRIIAYQYGAPFAFYGHNTGHGIDSTYVDGISLTHGQSPRQHIWTFAAGSDDVNIDTSWVCACSHSQEVDPPSFIGEDYFCETANHIQSYTYSRHFYDHPLWDGQDCGSNNDTNCCSFHNPPWFCKHLPQPTTDDIELRQCNVWNQDSDTPLEIIEIYVK